MIHYGPGIDFAPNDTPNDEIIIPKVVRTKSEGQSEMFESMSKKS